MDHLIKAIYDKTIDIKNKLKEEDFESLNDLLNERSDLMANVDQIKSTDPDIHYSKSALKLLKDIAILDIQITEELTKLLSQNRTLIQDFKKNMQVSMMYQPYNKQTSGVFVDKKK